MRCFVQKSIGAVWGMVCMALICSAQVTVGDTTPPPPGVMFEVRSTDKGFLPPRLSGTQMAAIQNPPEGLIIFNTSLSSLMVFQAGSWKKILVPVPVPINVPQIDSSGRCGTGYGSSVDMDDGKAIVGCAAGVSFYTLDGQTWREEKFFPMTGLTAVAIFKNFAIAGVAAVNRAIFYEYISGIGWMETQEIRDLVFNNIKSEQFGFSVALSDSFAIIGDPGYNLKCGAVHIYRKHFAPLTQTQTGWELMKSVAGRSGDEFGHAVDINAQRFVVGEWLFDIGLKVQIPDAGLVHVYKISGTLWQVEATFTHSDSLRDARFGSSVSIYENRIAVGAQNMDDQARNKDQSGAVSIFEMLSENAWTPVANLTAANAGFNELVSLAHFGNSVSLFENRLLAGAYSHPGDFSGEGAVYVFERKYGRWYYTKKLENPARALNGFFGQSVSQFGPYQVAGAPGTRSGKGEVIFFKD